MCTAITAQLAQQVWYLEVKKGLVSKEFANDGVTKELWETTVAFG
jgi:hypothetical protein